jgi:hypothetical protein
MHQMLMVPLFSSHAKITWVYSSVVRLFGSKIANGSGSLQKTRTREPLVLGISETSKNWQRTDG